MILNQKINGGSLVYAILMSIIVAMICLNLILIKHSYAFLFIKKLEKEKYIHEIRNLKERSSLLPYDNEYTPILSHLKDTILFYSKTNWGLFDLISTHSHNVHLKKLSKTFLLGNKDTALQKAALYFPDKKREFSIGGNTIIKGNAYLPNGKIKIANIPGKQYSNTKDIFGEKYKSGENLPLLNKKKMTYLQSLSNQPHTGHKEILLDSTTVAFNDSTLFIHSHSMNLSNTYMDGRVCLIADSLIYISQTSTLTDVLLFAPIIHIEAGFKGSIQAFATEKLRTENNIILDYPSVLGLLPNGKNPEPELIISSGTLINGNIFAYEATPLKSVIKIQEQAVVVGDVFTNGIMELNGAIHGHLACQEFRYNNNISTYQNILVDAYIDATKKPSFFVAGNVYQKSTQPEIVKWLD